MNKTKDKLKNINVFDETQKEYITRCNVAVCTQRLPKLFNEDAQTLKDEKLFINKLDYDVLYKMDFKKLKQIVLFLEKFKESVVIQTTKTTILFKVKNDILENINISLPLTSNDKCGESENIYSLEYLKEFVNSFKLNEIANVELHLNSKGDYPLKITYLNKEYQPEYFILAPRMEN